MTDITDITQADALKKNTAVALGLFDGVHRGHMEVIKGAVQNAEQNDLQSAVFTFRTDSVTSKGHDGRIEMLLTDSMKAEIISRSGVELLFSPDFSRMKNMPPETFVKEVLKERLKCRCAFCGTDFTFGRGAVGNADDLKRLGKKYDIEVFAIDKLLFNGRPISSTDIRRFIRNGEISKANKMLGYNYGYKIPVEHGFQRGRTWNFPTINQIIPKGLVLPKFGVYCSKVNIDGKWYIGVTNIGIKPTVKVHTRPLAETFIVDFEGDLYGKEIEIRFFEFLRPEKIFPSFEELKKEISKNTNQVIEYFYNHADDDPRL